MNHHNSVALLIVTVRMYRFCGKHGREVRVAMYFLWEVVVPIGC